MRNLIFKLFLILFPTGLLVGLTNYCVDPANIFSSPAYTDGIARILSNGDNVNNLSNYNERRLQEEMIKRLRKTPDIIVLGDSRVMEIGSDFFPAASVLNCGVSHGNIDDLCGLVGEMDSLGRLPRELWIGVDHFLLDKAGTSEWESLADYRLHLLRKMGEKDNKVLYKGGSMFWHKCYSLLSFEYFESSLRFLQNRNSKTYQDVGKAVPRGYGRFADGTISYSDVYKNPDTAQTTIDARATGKKQAIGDADPGDLLLFYKLLDFLRQNGTKIYFILIPYHPALYRSVNFYHNGLLRSYETLYRKIARERNITVVGGYDAASFNIPDAQFYDMFHCTKQGIRSMFFQQELSSVIN